MAASFASDKIFSPDSALKSLKIYLNDVLILNEDIVTFDYQYIFDKTQITGTFLFKDSYSLYNKTSFDESMQISVTATDKFDVSVTKYYNVTSVNVESWENRFRYLKLTFIDSFTYTLMNTYISRSFFSTPVKVFNSMITYLGLDKYISNNNIKLNIVDSSADMSIVIPGDRSLYDYFRILFYKNGYRFWQDDNSINLLQNDITISNVLQNTDLNEDLIFTNAVDNYSYAFTIFDYRILYNQFLHINVSRPDEINYKFDYGKGLIDNTLNLSDLYNLISTGKQDLSKSNITIGAKLTQQPMINVYNHKLDIENIFLKNVQLEIVVKGNFKYSYLGKWVKIDLKGNSFDTQNSIEGDEFHSGLYFVYEVQDKFIVDKFIQKLTLIRFNNTK
jgi:hypothetical protein